MIETYTRISERRILLQEELQNNIQSLFDKEKAPIPQSSQKNLYKNLLTRDILIFNSEWKLLHGTNTADLNKLILFKKNKDKEIGAILISKKNYSELSRDEKNAADKARKHHFENNFAHQRGRRPLYYETLVKKIVCCLKEVYGCMESLPYTKTSGNEYKGPYLDVLRTALDVHLFFTSQTGQRPKDSYLVSFMKRSKY